MTAINIILQRRGAYIISDGAVTDSEGTLLQVAPKVTFLPRYRMAIAWTGFGPIDELDIRSDRIAAKISQRQPASQREVLQALPGILAELHAENVERIIHDNPEDVCIALMVALWDKKAREAQAWTCHSDNIALGPAYTPYSLVRLRGYIGVPGPEYKMDAYLHEVFGRQVDVADSASFHPAKDGITLLEAQRHIDTSTTGGGYSSCGGLAHLTSVTADGVKERVLKVWPDRIGEKIDPANVGDGSSRLARLPDFRWARAKSRA